MQIPNAQRAVIDPVKLHGYLLSHSHPVGRFKAVFFQALGYLSRDVTIEDHTAYGQKYSIRAPLVGPSGRSANVVSVWIVRTGEERPRFVTAYPEVGR